ncbi:MAG TPA: CPBP family intramembrane glutamic endopeptidase [Candidatus Polarisedimenticolia bacterium]|nr:CPBP family intramembrane glutamic endopeptidase [Candidatus Polarisedimenticolia bacterium]
MRPRLAPWAACALWMVTGWLAIFAASVAMLAALKALPDSAPLRTALNFLPNLLGISLVLLLGLKESPAPASQVLFLRPPRWILLPGVALATLGLALLAAELDTWIEEIFPAPEWVMEIFRRALEYHTAIEFAGVFFFLVVVAPVTEEVLFRGLFLSRLLERYSPRTAVIGSAVCFGVFHILPWQVVTAALMGLFLGWLLLRSGSIAVPIAAHAIFNLLPVLATRVDPERTPFLQVVGAQSQEPVHLPGIWLAGAAAAFLLGTAAIRSLTTESGGPAAS